jgi:hypothetical protein
MIAAMILFTIAIGVAVWCITVSSITEDVIWLLSLIITGVCIMIGMIIIDSIPTNKDVRERRAHYVEQNHIEVVNGDTINTYKTYKIEWIENSK